MIVGSFLTAVSTETAVVWVVAPCRPVEDSQPLCKFLALHVHTGSVAHPVFLVDTGGSFPGVRRSGHEAGSCLLLRVMRGAILPFVMRLCLGKLRGSDGAMFRGRQWSKQNCVLTPLQQDVEFTPSFVPHSRIECVEMKGHMWVFFQNAV
jgi:hypothetical protein